MYAPAPTPTPITVRTLRGGQDHNRRAAVLAEDGTLATTKKNNSLEKLQDGGDHLCDGLHGGILITAAHKTDKRNNRHVREAEA